MGFLGGILGGIGGMIGSGQQASADQQAAGAALTGYNYLTSGAGGAPENTYIGAGTNALSNQQGTQNTEAQLLGTQTLGSNATNGFNNYLNSTAYNFQLGQGTNAINSDAASKGLLDSGGTAKALQAYGQNLAGTTFNNYLSQLGNLNSQQGGTATMGQTALGQIGEAGTAGGQGASNALTNMGNAQAAGTQSLFSGIGNALSFL